VLGRRPVAPHHHHLFELEHRVPASYVRLNIYPDGGVARFRVFGEPDPTARTALRFRYLNALFDQEAHRFFHAACGSERFAGELVRGRPYSDPSVLWKAVEAAFATMSEQDWMEAFDRHPRIGGGDGGQGPTGEAMSAREQAGTTAASGPVQAALVEANARYEERFGFRFVVFAAGKTATEMLEIARRRLGNDRATEQEMAAAEQRRITDLRLRRMLCVEAVGDEEAG
ncbi:MAG: 2-oxo-4-hydroxy-4-carboxy-5-ureidoimidazoline decarboxylase, partial [Acidimicrobiia bacterium]